MPSTLVELLESLEELQHIDTQIQRTKRTQSLLDNGTASHAEFEAQTNKLAEAKASLHVLSAELKDSELKQSSLETKLKSYRERLYKGTITNARELSNIEKEISALERQISELDGIILELMEATDAAKLQVGTAEERSADSEMSYRAIVGAFRSAYDRLTGELTTLQAQRADKQVLVDDPALLKRYDELRVRNAGLGATRIVNGNCGGCNMKLPSGLIRSVEEKKELQVCDNCGRILVG